MGSLSHCCCCCAAAALAEPRALVARAAKRGKPCVRQAAQLDASRRHERAGAKDGARRGLSAPQKGGTAGGRRAVTKYSASAVRRGRAHMPGDPKAPGRPSQQGRARALSRNDRDPPKSHCHKVHLLYADPPGTPLDPPGHPEDPLPETLPGRPPRESLGRGSRSF